LQLFTALPIYEVLLIRLISLLLARLKNLIRSATTAQQAQ